MYESDRNIVPESTLESIMQTPLDKQSRPMKLLATVDLHDLSLRNSDSPGSNRYLPQHGIINIFVSHYIEQCQQKDRTCFKIIWTQGDTLAPYVIPNGGETTADSPQAHSPVMTGVSNLSIATDTHPRVEEAKAICAFSSNGITYNEARAKDDCYSHLVAQVPRWRLLLRISDGQNDYLLLIHENDLAQEQLEKAWLVLFKGNS